MTDPRFIRKTLTGKLSPAQRYALVMLMEECAEVTVFCSKASSSPPPATDAARVHLSPEQEAAVAEYVREMEEEVIPEIVATMRERVRLAVEVRSRPMFARIDTERTLHNAWRKRAEEAEASLRDSDLPSPDAGQVWSTPPAVSEDASAPAGAPTTHCDCSCSHTQPRRGGSCTREDCDCACEPTTPDASPSTPTMDAEGVERLLNLLEEYAHIREQLAPNRRSDTYHAWEAGLLRALASALPGMIDAERGVQAVWKMVKSEGRRADAAEQQLADARVTELEQQLADTYAFSEAYHRKLTAAEQQLADARRERDEMKNDQRAYAMCVGADPDSGFESVTEVAIRLWQEMKGHQERATAAEKRLSSFSAEAIRRVEGLPTFYHPGSEAQVIVRSAVLDALKRRSQ